MDALIGVLASGDDTTGEATRETEDLAEWLREDRGLDALVRLAPRRAEATYLGGAVEIALAAMGSGGLALPLYKSVVAWLKTRATHLTVKVTTDRGSVEIKAANIDEEKIRRLLDDILYGPAGGDSDDPGGDGPDSAGPDSAGPDGAGESDG